MGAADIALHLAKGLPAFIEAGHPDKD